jgi:hypothetical protein
MDEINCLRRRKRFFTRSQAQRVEIADPDESISDYIRVKIPDVFSLGFAAEEIPIEPGQGFVISDRDPVGELGFSQDPVKREILAGVVVEKSHRLAEALFEGTALRRQGLSGRRSGRRWDR